MVVKNAAVSVVLGAAFSLSHIGSIQAAVSYAPPPPTSTSVATAAAPDADNPEFIAKGNLDGVGGDNDLVTVNETDGTVTVLLRNGAGALTSNASYGVGNTPRHVVIGDLDGVNGNDLVVPNVQSGNVTVLLNNGSGVFTPHPDSPIDITASAGPTARPIAPVIGQFNSGTDAFADIAISNDTTNNVQVLLGQADGSFIAGATIPVGLKPTSMTVGDLDADGDTDDLVVANFDDVTVSVLHGDGAGGFTPAQTLTTGAKPWSVQIGLIDSDALPDLAVANYNVNSTVRVYLGVPGGTFNTTLASSTTVELKPHSVEITELNGDAFADLVVSNDNDPTVTDPPTTGVTVLLGDGAGNFPTVTHYPVSGQPNGVVSANLDGANQLDLAVANGTTGNVDVLLNVPTANPPTATAATLTVNEDTATNGTLTGTDLDGAQLKFALDGTSPPTNGTVTITDPATGAYTYTPTADVNGGDTFDFTVDDGTGVSSPATITVTITAVNDAPTVTAPGSITVTEDVASALTGISFTDIDAASASVTASLTVGSGTLAATSGGGVTVGGSGTATLTLSGSVANINTFIAGSNVTFTTAANATASVTLGVSINDGGNTGSGGAQSSGTTNVTLNVTAVNDAPTISGTPATTVNEDTAYSFTPTAGDVDAGDTLTFSITNKPSWATFNTTTGALTGTPANGDVGTTAGIVITVTDGNSAPVSLASFNLQVVNVNDAPTISGTPATTVNEDSAYSFTPTAGDVDVGDTLTFSITNKPAWATFNTTTGALTGTPTNADVGTTTGIVITVTDSSLASTSLASFNLQVVNVNDAPTISGTPATSVVEDVAYSFTPTAGDVDVGDTLTFSITNKPAWAGFDTATGALTGTPVYADVGTTTGIVISVNDGTVSTALPSFDLAVVELDSNSDGLSDRQAAAVGLDPTLTDTDGDTISDAIEVGGIPIPASPTDTDADGVIDALEFGAADPTLLGFVVPAPTATALSLTDLSGLQVTLSGNGAAITANTNGSTGLPLYAEGDLATADSAYTYPFGVYDFRVVTSGGMATVTLTLPSGITIPSNAVVRKLTAANQWQTLGASVAVINTSNNTITLTLSDNDPAFDLNSTTGVIRDPVGVAVPVATSAGGGGGGGCSLDANPRKAGFDPLLPLLVFGSMLYLRRQRKGRAE